MPGFLIFEEFGKAMEAVDAMTRTLSPTQAALAKKAAKAALLRTPGSWMTHGIIGEQNVDVDPVAAMNKIADGQSPVSIGLDPYKGWIPLVSISQSVESTAEHEKRRLKETVNDGPQKVNGLSGFQPGTTASGVTGRLSAPNRVVEPETGGTFKTAMTGAGGVDQISVEVELDVSFPKLLKMVLKSDELEGRKKRSSADIHLCTHAAIDMSQVTLGNNSPAAQMVQTLLSLGFADVVPYLSIHMQEVSVTDVSFQLLGDAEGSVPSANFTLEFETIKWTYHIINGSNMNLFDVDFEYEIKSRERDTGPGSGLLSKMSALKNTLNPFT